MDDNDDGSDYYYRVMWGFDRDEAHTKERRVRNGENAKKRRDAGYVEERNDNTTSAAKDSHSSSYSSFNQAAGVVCVVCHRTNCSCQAPQPIVRKTLRLPGQMSFER